MNILVLCTGNSARSILLEAILQSSGRAALNAYSAGSTPTGRVNPGAIRCLERHGIQHPQARSKSWDEFEGPEAPIMDLVITVCGNARDETCPIWPGAPLSTHWGVEDPADVKAPVEAVDAAFEEAFHILRHRAELFLALDPSNLDKTLLDEIGTKVP